MFKINKIFLLIPVALVLFATLYASVPLIHAADPAPGTYVPLAPLPGAAPSTGTNFNTYVRGLFALLIGVAAVLSVLMIVIGGIQYMSTDAISGKSEGKEKITQALYGLFIAMACWLILYTINPNILNFDVLNKDSFPVSYNAGYSYGVTPPGSPGWYMRYEYQCVLRENTWQVGYYGPVATQEYCNSIVLTTAVCPATPGHEAYPAEYQNISCVQVP